jgi:hypothetical protein
MKTINTVVFAILAFAGIQPWAKAQTIIDLGAAQSFAVLAGAGVTVAGAVNSTTIQGDLGSYPTQTITGLGNVALIGTHQSPTVEALAKPDLQSAYNAAAAATPTETFPAASDLGGLTLPAGVYKNPSSFAVTGTLTLDAQGNPNAVWIIQMGSTLTTAANSQILLINGAQAANVFWQVGSSATLGTLSSFVGTMLVETSITLTTGATVDGQLLALNGTVTLDTNDIAVAGSVPEPAGTSFLIVGGLGLLVGFWGLRYHLTGRGEHGQFFRFSPKLLLATVGLAALPRLALAQFTDNFTTLNPAWIPNRYAPAGFNAVEFAGTSALQLTIADTDDTANRPFDFSSTFYNTQGDQRAAGITGVWTLNADLYISSAFDTTTGPIVQTDLWGHTGTTPGGGDYATFGITNASPTDPLNPNAPDRAFTLEAFDSFTAAWVPLGVPAGLQFDAWNTLTEISTGTEFEFELNGVNLLTTPTDAGDDLLSVIIQGHNFGQTGSYAVDWTNVEAIGVPEPATNALLAGLAVLGLVCWRRRRT